MTGNSLYRCLLACFGLWLVLFGRPALGAEALLLKVTGAIGPATSEYIQRGLQEARERKSDFVILEMDTPGGLDTSMREIIKELLGAELPVVVYISPEGARAASAGTYILYAAHVAAMAPATNLGAATPVSIGGTPSLPSDKKKEKESESGQQDAMSRKAVNDAKAYLRSLAQLRGRNVEWAERAVESAESLSAEEALHQKVIDLVARDRKDLLVQLEGRRVAVLDKTVVLQAAGAQIREVEPGWKIRMLGVLSNPNVAYLLLLLGIYGLIFEFSNPGSVLPGVLGAICLLLALYGLHLLPINYTGLALVLLGVALMVAEAFVPSFGVLGIGGIFAFLIGSLILIDTEFEGFRLSHSLVFSFTAVTALVLLGVVGMAIRSRRRKVVSGAEELLGAVGEALEDFKENGLVFLHGETWQALSANELKKGDKVIVTGREGLVLSVQAASTSSQEGSS